jgi:hypothetical protein
MSTADVNRVIVTGENSAIRLSPTDSGSFTTNASFCVSCLLRQAPAMFST